MGKLLSGIGGIAIVTLCVVVGWKAKEESLKERPVKDPVVEKEQVVEEVAEEVAEETKED